MKRLLSPAGRKITTSSTPPPDASAAHGPGRVSRPACKTAPPRSAPAGEPSPPTTAIARTSSDRNGSNEPGASPAGTEAMYRAPAAPASAPEIASAMTRPRSGDDPSHGARCGSSRAATMRAPAIVLRSRATATAAATAMTAVTAPTRPGLACTEACPTFKSATGAAAAAASPSTANARLACRRAARASAASSAPIAIAETTTRPYHGPGVTAARAAPNPASPHCPSTISPEKIHATPTDNAASARHADVAYRI